MAPASKAMPSEATVINAILLFISATPSNVYKQCLDGLAYGLIMEIVYMHMYYSSHG